MGRKIPGRKHRGVIDPVKQQKRRTELLKKVINAPPQSLDQPIPKSMLEFARLKQIGQKSQFDSAGKKKKDLGGVFVRGVKSEDKGTNKAKLSFALRKKFINTEVVGKAYSGSQADGLSENSDDEIIDETHGKLKWKNGLQKKKKKGAVEPTKKIDRRKEKKKKLLEKRREKLEEKTSLLKKDVVAFGEVVHEPPSMRVKPKYAADNERQMGLKDLHLKKMLARGTVAPVAMVSGSTEAKPKVRLRDLPANKRDEIEKNQQQAIAAYRLIKARKSAPLKS